MVINYQLLSMAINTNILCSLCDRYHLKFIYMKIKQISNANKQMANIKQRQFQNYQKALAKKVMRVNAKDKRDIVR